jgi:hypothetical protein
MKYAGSEAVPHEGFLEELTPDFPPAHIYSYDENVRYTCERQTLMDEVLEGTFESFVREVREAGFSYRITADEYFSLEVAAGGQRWTRTFGYITEAFDIAEAAYRFFIVMPRVLDEGGVLLEAERKLQAGKESRAMHDHCEGQTGSRPSGTIVLPGFTAQGATARATVRLCTDGSCILGIEHLVPEPAKRRLPDRFYADPDFAALIAAEYVRQCDTAGFTGTDDEIYRRVYSRVTH